MDDDLALPGPAALLGATLALMTAYAGAGSGTAAESPDPAHRQLMARKIVSNLFFLQAHPQLAPGLRQVASSLHARWAGLCGGQGP